MRKKAVAWGFVVLFLPISVHAGIVVSEFLYDADGTDANKEYVEIFNAGSSAVDLTKWKLNDGSNHTLNVPPKNGGTGTITLEAGAYALLVDRAEDFVAAHPGISASVIDTVLSLPNAGGSILLIAEDGSTADSVSYTKDSGGAGDGNSLHRVSAGGNVFTEGAPTRGSGTLSASSAGNAVSASSTTSGGAASSVSWLPPVSSYVPPPLPRLYADAGKDRSIIVAADVEFKGRAYNRDQEIVENVRFSWNFGDGTTAEGQTVLHHFAYPGRYAVVLSIAESKDAAIDTMIVSAEPAQLSLTSHEDGSIAIGNLAGRDLDLSGWIVRSPADYFILPPESVLLSGAMLRIGEKTLGFRTDSSTALNYPNGVLALSAGGSQAAPARAPVAAASLAAASSGEAADEPIREVFSEQSTEEEPEAQSTRDDTEEEPASAQVAAAAEAPARNMWWWIGAVGFILAGAGTASYMRRTQSKGWEITDESGTS